MTDEERNLLAELAAEKGECPECVEGSIPFFNAISGIEDFARCENCEGTGKVARFPIVPDDSIRTVQDEREEAL